MKQITDKSGEHVMTSSVLIRSGGMIATDRVIISEFWHGLGFPTLAVPAQFVDAVLRVMGKNLVSFGFSDRSVTFYFDDHSFIRSQLYADEWPDVDHVLPNQFAGLKPVPEKFFEAMSMLKPFADKCVLCDEGVMKTNDETDTGATMDCPGLIRSPGGIDHVRLLPLAGKITHLDYTTDPTRIVFQGPSLRGVCVAHVIPGRDKPPEPAPASAPQPAPAPSGFTLPTA